MNTNILKFFLLVVIFTTLLFSCRSIKISPKEDRIKIGENQNFSELVGIYENTSIDSTVGRFYTLWGRLGVDNNYEYKNFNVEISFENNHKVIAKLINNGKIVDTKIIRGKIQDNCFYLRRKFMILPFIPIVFGFSDAESRLSFFDDMLIVDSYWYAAVNIFVFPLTDNGEYSFRFRKIKIND